MQEIALPRSSHSAVVLPLSVIFSLFGRYMPLVLFALLAWWLFITIPIFAVCQATTDLETARFVGCISGAVVTAVLFLGCVWHFGRQFSRYEFALKDDHLVIRGISGWRFLSKKIKLASIASISLGDELSGAAKIATSAGHIGLGNRRAARLLTEVTASRLIVEKNNQTRYHIDFVDFVFEHDSLLAVLNSLSKRGVTVAANA